MASIPTPLPACLEGVPQLRLKGDAVEAADFLDAGRRGDVDLGEVITDHVDPDEQQAASAQLRSDRLADRQIAWRERPFLRSGADVQIGARLPRLRYPSKRAGGAAVDQDDALVAPADLRQIALHDDRLAVEAGEHLQQCVQVVV